MTDNTQSTALLLADALEGNARTAWTREEAAAELRRQHARIVELEAQLEAIGAGGVSPLIGQQASDSFSAADMATAAAQGFRDGADSVAASAGSEPVAADGWLHENGLLYRLTDERHPCNRDEINVTMADGSRSIESRSRRALELLDRIRTNHPSPPDGMVGEWISVDERLPKCSRKPDSLGVEVLIWPPHEDGSRTAFYGRRQSREPNFYKYGALLCHVEFWRYPPPSPTTSAGSGKGE